MSIAEGIAAVKTGFDIAKSVRDLVKKPTIDANEVSSQLLLLQQVMLDSQQALNEADVEIRGLREQLDKRKELEDDKVWEADGSFYRRQSDIDEKRFIPYCPICWTAANNAIPMAPQNIPGTCKCGLHDSVYHTKEYDKYIDERNTRARQANRSGGGGSNSWMG